jgi:hypothetical protein
MLCGMAFSEKLRGGKAALSGVNFLVFDLAEMGVIGIRCNSQKKAPRRNEWEYNAA